MFLHFCKHPFVFLVKQFLYLLPVSISDIDWDLKFGRGIFQNIVNMLIDSVNLATYVCNSRVQFSLCTLILLDGRLQLKSGIDPSIRGLSMLSSQRPDYLAPDWPRHSRILPLNFLWTSPHILSNRAYPHGLTFWYLTYWNDLTMETTFNWLWLAHGVTILGHRWQTCVVLVFFISPSWVSGGTSPRSASFRIRT
jgi:hypothetical protein